MSGADDDSTRNGFGDGLGGVKPLTGRDRNVIRPGRPAAGPRSESQPASDPFVHPDPAQPRLAQRRSAPPGTAERLHTGSPKPDKRLDLHGTRAADAAEATRHAIDTCVRSGGSLLLVIHGRGKHSGGHGVLREELPGWLEAHARVVAYAPARGRDGGAGATLVRLRTG